MKLTFVSIRRALSQPVTVMTGLALAAAFATTTVVVAQEGGLPEGAGTASQQELELLRRLLGVPAAEPSVEEPEPAAAPAVVEEEKPKPARASTPKAAAKPAARPAKRVVRPSPAPRPAATPARAQEAPSAVEQGTSTTQTSVPATQPPTTEAQEVEGAKIPAAGTVIDARNVEEWKHLLGPSVQWSIERGAHIDVVDAQPMPLEPLRIAATQKYSAQVRLSADKRSIENYVAGMPFPFVDENDPDAAPKMMFNMENRINQDDLDVRNFSCDTGTLDGPQGFTIQRHYAIEHFRRFYHVGRLVVDPKPNWPTADGARYREMLHPLVEPFDLKGAGFTYIRYLDPNRQDDSWLYFPQLKRVRRLGTAQRSEGVFGQDVDLDSYGGFAGNPAWTSWTFLGRKTILASTHARNFPSKFQAAPAAFFPDDVWEPREVYVILGISQLGGYNFGRRVIYLDRESWLIPYTEIYDRTGQLWRTLIHAWNQSDRPRPKATRAIYDTQHPFISSFSLIDMQLNHATRCQFPAAGMTEEDGWYYHFGDQEGTVPEAFSVSNFIGAGR